MKGATVATTSSRALLAACARIGLECDVLLAAAGLSAAEVDDPDGRLPGDAVARLWSAALDRSGAPDLGLRVALAVPFGAYRILDFLAASAPTVGEGLRRVARYFPLINTKVEWRIAEEPARVRMELAVPGPSVEVPRPYAEYALVVTVLHCRHASGFDWPLEEVAFSFLPPPTPEAHERALGCPVRFEASRTEIAIARATWDTPTRSGSSALLATLEEHADRLLDSLRSEHAVEARVGRLLAEELQGGDPSLAPIARRLAMSPRTLQRRLEEAGTSFAEILDRTRRHVAEVYVRERQIALTEVAYLLGFSEQSAFTRAFHRWYGVPPSRFRREGAT